MNKKYAIVLYNKCKNHFIEMKKDIIILIIIILVTK